MESNAAIQELEKAKSELLEKVAQIDNTIAMLRSMSGLINSNGNGHNGSSTEEYNKKDTLKKKVAFIIKREGRFLHIREISEYLNKLEPNTSTETFLERLTGAITSLRIDGIIAKIKLSSSHQSTFWGSVNWVDANGKCKAGFEPKEGVIKKPEAIVI